MQVIEQACLSCKHGDAAIHEEQRMFYAYMLKKESVDLLVLTFLNEYKERCILSTTIAVRSGSDKCKIIFKAFLNHVLNQTFSYCMLHGHLFRVIRFLMWLLFVLIYCEVNTYTMHKLGKANPDGTNQKLTFDMLYINTHKKARA